MLAYCENKVLLHVGSGGRDEGPGGNIGKKPGKKLRSILLFEKQKVGEDRGMGIWDVVWDQIRGPRCVGCNLCDDHQ